MPDTNSFYLQGGAMTDHPIDDDQYEYDLNDFDEEEIEEEIYEEDEEYDEELDTDDYLEEDEDSYDDEYDDYDWIHSAGKLKDRLHVLVLNYIWVNQEL